jgi:hypothetical protein
MRGIGLRPKKNKSSYLELITVGQLHRETDALVRADLEGGREGGREGRERR